MRRVVLLLSLTVAAVTAAPAAHAQQGCVQAWTDGNSIPNTHPSPFCFNAPMQGGPSCDQYDAEVYPEAGVHVFDCIPFVLPIR
jgi:hypothetical protein